MTKIFNFGTQHDQIHISVRCIRVEIWLRMLLEIQLRHIFHDQNVPYFHKIASLFTNISLTMQFEQYQSNLLNKLVGSLLDNSLYFFHA